MAIANSSSGRAVADTERLVIDHVGHRGDGVTSVGGESVYVPYTLGGETVEVTPVPLIVNVYTELECRGQGVARALMRVLMKWASTLGSDRVVLHASDAGRPLYTSLGFHPTNEMRWFPPKDFDHN